MINITFYADGKPVGVIRYEVEDIDDATGRVHSIEFSSRLDIMNFVKRNIRKNEVDIRIVGGLRPDSVGKYCDAMAALMIRTEKEFGITIDYSLLPMPKLPKGATA